MDKVKDLYDLSHTIAGEYLEQFAYPWEALSGIAEMIRTLGRDLDATEYTRVAEEVWVHRSAKIAVTASLTGPAIIGPGAEIRHCAYIRGSALVGGN